MVKTLIFFVFNKSKHTGSKGKKLSSPNIAAINAKWNNLDYLIN